MQRIAELVAGLSQPEAELVWNVRIGHAEGVNAGRALKDLGVGKTLITGLGIEAIAVFRRSGLKAPIDAGFRLEELTSGLGEVDYVIGIAATGISAQPNASATTTPSVVATIARYNITIVFPPDCSGVRHEGGRRHSAKVCHY